MSIILTISVPLNVWFEALDIRIDDNCAAQTHCLAFSPKGYIKFVDKADFKPGSIAMRSNSNCMKKKKSGFLSFCDKSRKKKYSVIMNTVPGKVQGINRNSMYIKSLSSEVIVVLDNTCLFYFRESTISSFVQL